MAPKSRKPNITLVQSISYMVQVKAVLFDYGMVLSAPPDPSAWARIRTLTNLTEEILYREYWAHRHAYDRGDLTAEAYWHKAAAGAGIVLTPTQLTALLAADVDLWTQINAPMLEWAQRLQRAGIPTGILSNIGDAMAAGLLTKFDWLGAFNHHTWSYALNLAKPEPAIYLHAIEGLHTPPENILFIDDKPENIATALSVGMQAIQYTTHDAFEQEMHTRNLDSLLQLENPVSQNGKL
jgi:putative hydrolase of the HAD superfamily